MINLDFDSLLDFKRGFYDTLEILQVNGSIVHEDRSCDYVKTIVEIPKDKSHVYTNHGTVTSEYIKHSDGTPYDVGAAHACNAVDFLQGLAKA